MVCYDLNVVFTAELAENAETLFFISNNSRIEIGARKFAPASQLFDSSHLPLRP